MCDHVWSMSRVTSIVRDVKYRMFTFFRILPSSSGKFTDFHHTEVCTPSPLPSFPLHLLIPLLRTTREIKSVVKRTSVTNTGCHVLARFYKFSIDYVWIACLYWYISICLIFSFGRSCIH